MWLAKQAGWADTRQASTGLFQRTERFLGQAVLQRLEDVALLEADVVMQEPAELVHGCRLGHRVAARPAQGLVLFPDPIGQRRLANGLERREQDVLFDPEMRLEVRLDGGLHRRPEFF